MFACLSALSIQEVGVGLLRSNRDEPELSGPGASLRSTPATPEVKPDRALAHSGRLAQARWLSIRRGQPGSPPLLSHRARMIAFPFPGGCA